MKRNLNFIEITCPKNSSDAKLFTALINQGIDAHLEAFTRSIFDHNETRVVLNFHILELPTLVRRLEEIGTEYADSWAFDIQDLPEYERFK